MTRRALRVLHCIYDDVKNPWVGGGGAVRVFELYRRLTDRVDATVVTGRYPGARDEQREGVRYRRVGVDRPYPASRLSYALEARRLLRTEVYDAAVFDFSGFTPLFVPHDRPVGITVHHLSAPGVRRRWGRGAAGALDLLERGMLRRAGQFSVTSEGMLEGVRRLAPPGAAVEQVGAGVPEALFDLARQEQDYVLYLGRMDVAHKGLDTLLAASALLARQRPDLTLKVAGRGPAGPRVLELAARLGISRQVRVLGAVSDEVRAELLAGALVQLMPSRFEGFGLAAAEAMAAGVPLVASTAGALPEVVGDGGVLVPPDDPQALAAATEALLDDPGRRQRLSQAARRRAARYRWSSVAEAHLAFLQRIAGSAA